MNILIVETFAYIYYMIVTLAHQKGGVSKSTICLNLVAYAAKEGDKVAILDYDPQGSIRELYNTFEETQYFDLLDIPSKVKPLDDLNYNLIAIDTPPYQRGLYLKIFSISDVVLIPCKPSTFDVLAIRSTIQIIEQAKESRPKLKACIVLVGCRDNSPFDKEVLAHLSSYNIPILKTTIGDRITYRRTLYNRFAVFSENNKKARNEITDLANEIINLYV